jgi:TfoX/Sxy family transcriptional regulator of competence genes
VISTHEVFGEKGVFCKGKLVALVCDGRLFIKPTVAGRACLRTVTEATPYEPDGQYLLVPANRCSNAEWLARLFKHSSAELSSIEKGE